MRIFVIYLILGTNPFLSCIAMTLDKKMKLTGGVDKGGPVRDAATEVCKLLVNLNQLRQVRNSHASPNSLVPIGDDSVGFVTDEVRLMVLKKRIEEEHRIRLQSNLAKSEGSFGAGYNARDGTTVVGAAHGIEEMIKMAKKETTKYSDDSNGNVSRDAALLAELAAESQAANTVDLLCLDNPGPSQHTSHQPLSGQADLLDFGAAASKTSNCFLGGPDLLGNVAASQNLTTLSASNDLLGIGTMQQSANSGYADLRGAGQMGQSAIVAQVIDPFAATSAHSVSLLATVGGTSGVPVAVQSNLPGEVDPSNGGVSALMSGMSLSSETGGTAKKSIMGGSTQDRFAALDALTIAGGINPSASLSSGGLGFSKPPLDDLTGMNVANAGGGARLSGNDTSMIGKPAPLQSVAPPPLQQEPISPAGVGQVSATYGDGQEDADNPFVMGGLPGAGLEPAAPPPGVPPPPPPT